MAQLDFKPLGMLVCYLLTETLTPDAHYTIVHTDKVDEWKQRYTFIGTSLDSGKGFRTVQHNSIDLLSVLHVCFVLCRCPGSSTL